jgi:hypothetical protein
VTQLGLAEIGLQPDSAARFHGSSAAAVSGAAVLLLSAAIGQRPRRDFRRLHIGFGICKRVHGGFGKGSGGFGSEMGLRTYTTHIQEGHLPAFDFSARRFRRPQNFMTPSTPTVLNALRHWLPQLSPTEYKIYSYLCFAATTTPDGKVSNSIQQIADATKLAWRTVQEKLRAIEERGAIRILSIDKERTLVELPGLHGPAAAPATLKKPPVQPPATIPELVLRLAQQRPTPELLACMQDAAGNDENLQQYLSSLLPKFDRWENPDGLTVAVQHHFRKHGW